jgi:Zn-finger protein
MTATLIEKSVRLALRYSVNGKLISTEDLYNCKLPDLDVAYKELNRQLREQVEDGLSDVKSQLTEQLELRREVIKYVYATLTFEAVERETTRVKLANKVQLKRQLLEAIHEDDLKQLKELSKEEKIKMLEQLG